jgi:RNA polymerase sigma factor (sigma-70 family)
MFPVTTFGLVSRLRASSAVKERRNTLETLCQRYWAPVSVYAKAAFGANDHDAQDFAQEFFAWLLDAEVLQRYTPDRGSFRSYLKGLLRNFERNRARAGRRTKRGGGLRPLSLDDPSNREGERDVADPRDSNPGLEFDRAWIGAVMSRALARLRDSSAADPRRALRWRVFEAYDLVSENDRPTYAALASRFDLGASQVRHALVSAREALREAVRTELSDTVADPRALEEEWSALLGGG